MIYAIVDYWIENNIYYAIYYKDNDLYFSESQGLLENKNKQLNPFLEFIKRIINKKDK